MILICFVFLDKQWGGGTVTPDKEGWSNSVGKHKAKPWKPGNRNPELGRFASSFLFF